jgi:hypothetical protein
MLLVPHLQQTMATATAGGDFAADDVCTPADDVCTQATRISSHFFTFK